MQNQRLGIVTVLLATLAFTAPVQTAAAKGSDPFIGQWDVDVAKSMLNQPPPLTSGRVTFTPVKGGRKAVVDYARGTVVVHYEYAGPTDGTMIPVTGNTYFDSCTILQLNRNAFVRTERRSGKVVGVTTVEVAKDGKTATATARGTLSDGTTFNGTTVFNRAKK